MDEPSLAAKVNMILVVYQKCSNKHGSYSYFNKFCILTAPRRLIDDPAREITRLSDINPQLNCN
jgi:hypothetical protein